MKRLIWILPLLLSCTTPLPTEPVAPEEPVRLGRVRPVSPDMYGWEVKHPPILIRPAPEGATWYRDGSLVRVVYWRIEDCGVDWWVGILRVTQPCGQPSRQLEVHTRERTITMTIPKVPCE